MLSVLAPILKREADQAPRPLQQERIKHGLEPNRRRSSAKRHQLRKRRLFGEKPVRRMMAAATAAAST